MRKYKHGMETTRAKTPGLNPAAGKSIIQVVIGTAPINTLDNPMEAVNKPVLIEDSEDADYKIGYTKEIERYTAIHSVYASFSKQSVSPIIVINVLNPEDINHVEVVAGKEYPVIKRVITVKDTGILRDKVVVSDSDTEYQEDVDYVTSFNDDGYLVIGVTKDGALNGKASAIVSYTKLNPEGVTKEDIIGGVDEDYIKTGVELIDDVYPSTKAVPTLVVAPVYSKYPEVAAALEAKVQKIYSMFNGVAFVDMDTSSAGASNFTKASGWKEDNIPASRWVIPFYPMVKVDGMVLSFSAFAAAAYQRVTTDNKNIPSESIDNTELGIDGICTEDGAEVIMTQEDVNDYLNAYGIVGALKLPEWKAWGNNTAAYPSSEDPVDRWIKSVFMLNYMENKFKSDFLSKIGRSANYKLIESIVNEFNMTLNSLVPDYLAGGEIVFSRKDNPIEKLRIGRLKFKTRYADYAPAEYIQNEFAYDINMLENALLGGEVDE